MSILDRRLRIGFVSPWPVDVRGSWSGMIFPMYRALAAAADVTPVTTARVRPTLVDRTATRLLNGRHGQHYLPDHTVLTAKKRARLLRNRLRHLDIDVLVDVAASTDFAYLTPSCPVVHISDATFNVIEGYYPMFSNLLPISRWQAQLVARNATRVGDHYVVATDWVASSLQRDYRIPMSHVAVAPFGPGIDPPDTLDRVPSQGAPLRALFVCSDWERKGGPIVIEAVKAARSSGIPIELTIVGEAPLGLPPFVTSLGRTSHTDMAGIYCDHDVLLEPTRANAAGVTLTDAAAFGLPCIASDTGGVGTIVEHGRTGFLLPAENYVSGVSAALIHLQSLEARREMGAAARGTYESRLNWRAWADTVLQTAARALTTGGAQLGRQQITPRPAENR